MIDEVEKTIDPKQSKSIWSIMAIALMLVIIVSLTIFNVNYSQKTIAINADTRKNLDKIEQLIEIQDVLIVSYKHIIQKQAIQIKDYEEMNLMNEELQKIQVKIIRDHGLEQELIDQM